MQKLTGILSGEKNRLHKLLTGIDEMGAAMLLVEIGDDMSAFGTPAKLASWAGVCPGNNESGGKKKSGKARKGNPYVRRILCEAANAASKTRCQLSDKFKGLMIRRGRKRAIFAIAHKLLKTVFLLIERSDYYTGC
jgi:transposase